MEKDCNVPVTIWNTFETAPKTHTPIAVKIRPDGSFTYEGFVARIHKDGNCFLLIKYKNKKGDINWSKFTPPKAYLWKYL